LRDQELPVLDLLYLLGGSFFFVLAALYTTACDRL